MYLNIWNASLFKQVFKNWWY